MTSDCKINPPPAAAQGRGKGRFRRITRFIPALAVILLFGLVAFLSVQIRSQGEIIKEKNQSGLKRQQEALNVVALALEPDLIQDRTTLPGVVKPWISLQLVAEVGGKITRKMVQEGASVQKGDLIATIDPRNYQNALKAAKAAYELAQSDFGRLQALYRRQVIPESQLENVRAQVETTQAAMNDAAINLERCAIKAPFSGVVNRIVIEEGQYLSSGDPVAEILQIERVKVRVGIPESDVEAVRRLDAFRVKIDALGGQQFQARKYYLSKTADPMARLYDLDLELDNPLGSILPDMFARVEIVKNANPQGLAVPLYAVITRSQGHAVYVVEQDRARERTIVLGVLDGWRVEVKDGLKPGDQVIIVGHRSVNDGDPVKVVRRVREAEEIVQ